MTATDIRRLTADELPAFAAIAANAYPGMSVTTPEDRQRMVERWMPQLADPAVAYTGAFRDGTLVGGMKLYDFTMNIFGTQTLTGGVGLVAVDLAHKKEHVARDMVRAFIHHYRERGAPLVELYPFRPDFYRQMGFGYGTKQNGYSFAPASLPQSATREHVRFLTVEDARAMAECYKRMQRRTHGLIARTAATWERVFATPEQRIVGYVRDGLVAGYLVFTLKPDPTVNWITTDIEVAELIYETPDALCELLAFLRSQSDQIRRIVIATQDDELHFMPSDPRDGTNRILAHVAHAADTQAVGIMYRVVDVPGIFAILREHDFGGQTLRLKLTVRDSFIPENNGDVVVHFNNGRPVVAGDSDSDTQISLDVAEFSSLLMGCVSFRSLHNYGLARISDPAHVDAVDRLFRAERKPLCLTNF